MSIYDVHKVFTPTTPARLTFVERDYLNTKLVNALRTPGKQVIVHGFSGSGKSTLLVNKLHQLYEAHLTSRCMESLTLDSLVLDAFDQLSPFYCNEKSNVSTSSYTAKLSQDYLAIKSEISGSRSTQIGSKITRALPPQLTPQSLARFIGAANSCWVLEDFHKIHEEERSKLSQVMKIFMDLADDYPTLKIIAIGAVDTARQVVEYNSEMKNRVAEIDVPLMSATEVEKIIIMGQTLLNVKFTSAVRKGIVSYSSGLASVCHHLCLNVCTSQEIYETQNKSTRLGEAEFKRALEIYLDESSDTLKMAFDVAFKRQRARKYDNKRLIVEALSKLNQQGALRAELLNEIRKDVPRYPQGNLTRYLSELCGSETPVVRHDTATGLYSFTDPIYRAFAMTYFSDKQTKSSSDRLSEDSSILIKSISASLAASLVKALLP